MIHDKKRGAKVLPDWGLRMQSYRTKRTSSGSGFDGSKKTEQRNEYVIMKRRSCRCTLIVLGADKV